MSGITKKLCLGCKASIGVPCKTCPLCGQAQPYKERLDKRRRPFQQTQVEWAASVKRNRNSRVFVKSCHVLLDRLTALGFHPVLLLGKKNTNYIEADVILPKQNQVPVDVAIKLQKEFTSALMVHFQSHKTSSTPQENLDLQVKAKEATTTPLREGKPSPQEHLNLQVKAKEATTTPQKHLALQVKSREDTSTPLEHLKLQEKAKEATPTALREANSTSQKHLNLSVKTTENTQASPEHLKPQEKAKEATEAHLREASSTPQDVLTTRPDPQNPKANKRQKVCFHSLEPTSTTQEHLELHIKAVEATSTPTQAQETQDARDASSTPQEHLKLQVKAIEATSTPLRDASSTPQEHLKLQVKKRESTPATRLREANSTPQGHLNVQVKTRVPTLAPQERLERHATTREAAPKPQEAALNRQEVLGSLPEPQIQKAMKRQRDEDSATTIEAQDGEPKPFPETQKLKSVSAACETPGLAAQMQVEMKDSEQNHLQESMSGITKKLCLGCKASIGVACKSCPLCGQDQPYKERLDKRRRPFQQTQVEWAASVKRNRNTRVVVSSCHVLLDKLTALGFHPVLLLGKKNTNYIEADVILPKQNQVPVDVAIKLQKEFTSALMVHLQKHKSSSAHQEEMEQKYDHVTAFQQDEEVDEKPLAGLQCKTESDVTESTVTCNKTQQTSVKEEEED